VEAKILAARSWSHVRSPERVRGSGRYVAFPESNVAALVEFESEPDNEGVKLTRRWGWCTPARRGEGGQNVAAP